MKTLIQYDPTGEQVRNGQNACFRVLLQTKSGGKKYSKPLTSSELEAFCQAGYIKAQEGRAAALDPATALITSAFFNFKAGENRKPGEAAVPLPRSAVPDYNPSGVVKRYLPSAEALKGMGFKSLDHYLKSKGMKTRAERKESAEAKERQAQIQSMTLDLSCLEGL